MGFGLNGFFTNILHEYKMVRQTNLQKTDNALELYKRFKQHVQRNDLEKKII